MWFEIWKTIPDFPDYSASTHGRIRRDAGGQGAQAGWILKPRRGSRATKEGKVLNWCANLYRGGKRHPRLVHRLVLEAFVGKRPEGLECCHGDGDPANNRLENLRWDTSKANGADLIRHGNSNRGSRSPQAKLTEAQVKGIKRRLARFSGYGSGTALARQFGVSPDAISLIKHGKAWGWL